MPETPAAFSGHQQQLAPWAEGLNRSNTALNPDRQHPEEGHGGQQQQQQHVPLDDEQPQRQKDVEQQQQQQPPQRARQGFQQQHQAQAGAVLAVNNSNTSSNQALLAALNPLEFVLWQQRQHQRTLLERALHALTTLQADVDNLLQANQDHAAAATTAAGAAAVFADNTGSELCMQQQTGCSAASKHVAALTGQAQQEQQQPKMHAAAWPMTANASKQQLQQQQLPSSYLENQHILQQDWKQQRQQPFASKAETAEGQPAGMEEEQHDSWTIPAARQQQAFSTQGAATGASDRQQQHKDPARPSAVAHASASGVATLSASGYRDSFWGTDAGAAAESLTAAAAHATATVTAGSVPDATAAAEAAATVANAADMELFEAELLKSESGAPGRRLSDETVRQYYSARGWCGSDERQQQQQQGSCGMGRDESANSGAEAAAAAAAKAAAAGSVQPCCQAVLEVQAAARVSDAQQHEEGQQLDVADFEAQLLAMEVAEPGRQTSDRASAKAAQAEVKEAGATDTDSGAVAAGGSELASHTTAPAGETVGGAVEQTALGDSGAAGVAELDAFEADLLAAEASAPGRGLSDKSAAASAALSTETAEPGAPAVTEAPTDMPARHRTVTFQLSGDYGCNAASAASGNAASTDMPNGTRDAAGRAPTGEAGEHVENSTTSCAQPAAAAAGLLEGSPEAVRLAAQSCAATLPNSDASSSGVELHKLEAEAAAAAIITPPTCCSSSVGTDTSGTGAGAAILVGPASNPASISGSVRSSAYDSDSDDFEALMRANEKAARQAAGHAMEAAAEDRWWEDPAVEKESEQQQRQQPQRVWVQDGQPLTQQQGAVAPPGRQQSLTAVQQDNSAVHDAQCLSRLSGATDDTAPVTTTTEVASSAPELVPNHSSNSVGSSEQGSGIMLEFGRVGSIGGTSGLPLSPRTAAKTGILEFEWLAAQTVQPETGQQQQQQGDLEHAQQQQPDSVAQQGEEGCPKRGAGMVSGDHNQHDFAPPAGQQAPMQQAAQEPPQQLQQQQEACAQLKNQDVLSEPELMQANLGAAGSISLNATATAAKPGPAEEQGHRLCKHSSSNQGSRDSCSSAGSKELEIVLATASVPGLPEQGSSSSSSGDGNSGHAGSSNGTDGATSAQRSIGQVAAVPPAIRSNALQEATSSAVNEQQQQESERSPAALPLSSTVLAAGGGPDAMEASTTLPGMGTAVCFTAIGEAKPSPLQSAAAGEQHIEQQALVRQTPAQLLEYRHEGAVARVVPARAATGEALYSMVTLLAQRASELQRQDHNLTAVNADKSLCCESKPGRPEQQCQDTQESQLTECCELDSFRQAPQQPHLQPQQQGQLSRELVVTDHSPAPAGSSSSTAAVSKSRGPVPPISQQQQQLHQQQHGSPAYQHGGRADRICAECAVSPTSDAACVPGTPAAVDGQDVMSATPDNPASAMRGLGRQCSSSGGHDGDNSMGLKNSSSGMQFCSADQEHSLGSIAAAGSLSFANSSFVSLLGDDSTSSLASAAMVAAVKGQADLIPTGAPGAAVSTEPTAQAATAVADLHGSAVSCAAGNDGSTALCGLEHSAFAGHHFLGGSGLHPSSSCSPQLSSTGQADGCFDSGSSHMTKHGYDKHHHGIVRPRKQGQQEQQQPVCGCCAAVAATAAAAAAPGSHMQAATSKSNTWLAETAQRCESLTVCAVRPSSSSSSSGISCACSNGCIASTKSSSSCSSLLGADLGAADATIGGTTFVTAAGSKVEQQLIGEPSCPCCGCAGCAAGQWARHTAQPPPCGSKARHLCRHAQHSIQHTNHTMSVKEPGQCLTQKLAGFDRQLQHVEQVVQQDVLEEEKLHQHLQQSRQQLYQHKRQEHLYAAQIAVLEDDATGSCQQATWRAAAGRRGHQIGSALAASEAAAGGPSMAAADCSSRHAGLGLGSAPYGGSAFGVSVGSRMHTAGKLAFAELAAAADAAQADYAWPGPGHEDQQQQFAYIEPCSAVPYSCSRPWSAAASVDRGVQPSSRHCRSNTGSSWAHLHSSRNSSSSSRHYHHQRSTCAGGNMHGSGQGLSHLYGMPLESWVVPRIARHSHEPHCNATSCSSNCLQAPATPDLPENPSAAAAAAAAGILGKAALGLAPPDRLLSSSSAGGPFRPAAGARMDAVQAALWSSAVNGCEASSTRVRPASAPAAAARSAGCIAGRCNSLWSEVIHECQAEMLDQALLLSEAAGVAAESRVVAAALQTSWDILHG